MTSVSVGFGLWVCSMSLLTGLYTWKTRPEEPGHLREFRESMKNNPTFLKGTIKNNYSVVQENK